MVISINVEEPLDVPHEDVEDPGPHSSTDAKYIDAVWRAKENHYRMSRTWYPADTLPIARTMIGPGSLAMFLGSEPSFSEKTVWFNHCIKDVAEPEKLPPLKLDKSSKWWDISLEVLKETAALAKDKYLVGFQDLIENIDILASLRDNQTLLLDMIERPEWVSEKVDEINQAWFEAYDAMYEILKYDDDSSVFEAFSIWGPGKTAKLQCDASAMFSTAMFRKFVCPALTEQCNFLDHSLFHLDGHQCIPHLDALLEIEALDVIEWTPDPMVPRTGGNPYWYPMYKRILDAGKCVQAVSVQPDEIIPLLDAVGGKGMFLMGYTANRADLEKILPKLDQFR